MNFICSHHRSVLKGSPSKALLFWRQSLSTSRKHSAKGEYQEAISTYSNALEASEILLNNENSPERAGARYAITAIELVYTLRACNYQKSVDTLLQRVAIMLGKVNLSETIEPWLRSLKKAAGRTSSADYWASDQKISSTKRLLH